MTNHKQSFDSFLENELNSTQKKAVIHKTGSLLVIAGAGSGKTRVITARITNLIIKQNVLPSSIIALTFTNKAANEMKERVARFLGPEYPVPFIGTFHSYCVQILKRNAQHLETPFFSILDSDDQQKLISSILQRNGLQKKLTPRNVAYQISQMKNQNLDFDIKTTAQLVHPFMHDVIIAYEEEKKASKCLDFDDLLIYTLRLFKKKQEFKKNHQENIQHILVDEYQDTNVVQHDLLKQMAINNKQLSAQSICVVGDEDQSIYSWRGATIANILNFKKDFADTQIIKIEQNYRSVQPILEIANHVIQHNTNRNPKKLWSEKKGLDRIRAITCLSEYQEADGIAALIKTLQLKQDTQKIAILYRAHAQTRALEEALIKQSIPYKIIGGVQFYERKEIKDLIAYLRLIVNPFDRTSFFRIINCPTRGLGAKFEEQFYTRWHNEPFLTFIQVAEKFIDEKELTKSKQAAVKHFIGLFTHRTPTDAPGKALDEILNQTAYLQHLKDAYDPEEAQSRIDNIKELMNAIRHFENTSINTIDLFLDEVALMQDKMNSRKNEAEQVLLMTLHAAKGLEFDTVVLAGLEEGLLPNGRALQDDDAIEEERRLFYVGITRAKERLLITRAKFRYTYGQMVDQLSSRFLDEIPHDSVPNQDCSYWRTPEFESFFYDWLGLKNHNFTSIKTLPSTPTFSGARKTETVQKNTILSSWRKNQPVKHKKYGVGIVQKIENKSSDIIFITVKFKIGTKKIMAKFLQIV